MMMFIYVIASVLSFLCLAIMVAYKNSDIKKIEEVHMDKKIKKVITKEKGALKETKQLLKMDKKQDKKMEKCKMMPKKK